MPLLARVDARVLLRDGLHDVVVGGAGGLGALEEAPRLLELAQLRVRLRGAVQRLRVLGVHLERLLGVADGLALAVAAQLGRGEVELHLR